MWDCGFEIILFPSAYTFSTELQRFRWLRALENYRLFLSQKIVCKSCGIADLISSYFLLLTPSARNRSDFGGGERWKITDFFSHRKMSVKFIGSRTGRATSWRVAGWVTSMIILRPLEQRNATYSALLSVRHFGPASVRHFGSALALLWSIFGRLLQQRWFLFTIISNISCKLLRNNRRIILLYSTRNVIKYDSHEIGSS